MQEKSIRKRASALKIQKQAFLNDTYHWVEIARKAVQQLPPEQFEFEVPKAKCPEENHVVVRHHPEKVKARIMNKDLYSSAFVSSVAAVEDYLYKIIELFLLEDTRRIKCTIQGISMTNNVSVVDLIDKSKEELIHGVIEERLARLLQEDQKFFVSVDLLHRFGSLEDFDVQIGVSFLIAPREEDLQCASVTVD